MHLRFIHPTHLNGPPSLPEPIPQGWRPAILNCARRTRPFLGRAFREQEDAGRRPSPYIMTILPSSLASPLGRVVWLVSYCAPSTEHILIVRGLRGARREE